MRMKTASLAAGLMAVSMFATLPALGADLGGSCCADLEDRIAELEATTARKGNRKVSVTIYGQVSRAVMWHELDGEGNPGFEAGDNFNSPSRFGFRGEAKISADLKAGFVTEIGVGDDGLSIRHNYAYIERKDFGKVSLGHTSTAADGITEINLANSYVGALTPLGIGNLFDGGRTRVARYDSPTISGFTVSASVNDSEAWDVALRFAREFGEVRVAAGVAYSDLSGEDTRIAGSVSLMHTPSGIFLTGNAGRFDLDGISGKPTGWHLVGGVERKMFTEVGATTLFGEYADFKDMGVEDASMLGLGVTQRIDAAVLDVFLSYRRWDVADDYSTVMSGVRIQF